MRLSVQVGDLVTNNSDALGLLVCIRPPKSESRHWKENTHKVQWISTPFGYPSASWERPEWLEIVDESR